MSDTWTTEVDPAERRRRIAATSMDERLAWLRHIQEIAFESGALMRARERKFEEQERQWKYGKQ